KVRRYPYVSRARIHDDVVFGESANRAGGIIVRDHDERGACGRIRSTAEAEAVLLEAHEQVFGQVAIALANGNDADLVDDILTAECAVDGREGGSSELEASSIILEIEMMNVEVELRTRGEPAGDGGSELVQPFIADVEVRESRAAQKPLERAGDECVRAELR